MNRREALSAVSFLLGGTIIGAEIFLAGCNKPTPAQSTGLLTMDDIAFLDEVGEVILPTTASSPGAKEAKIGEFMNAIVTDCYNPGEQKIFREGISKLNEASSKKFSKTFVELTPEERHEMLLTIEQEVSVYKKTKKPEDPEHYYSMVKQLTVWGYFSSEVGAKQALRFDAVPGRYEACVPLEKGQKAWAL
jgi:hypothetical protein